MRQRICSFLVVLLLMFPGKIFAQVDQVFIKNISGLSIGSSPRPFESRFSAKKILKMPACGIEQRAFKLIGLPTATFYPSSLGVICKAELKLDKISPVPFRFRLGSLDYVNWLERKPNAVRPQ